jgi:CHAD domain-containing protein
MPYRIKRNEPVRKAARRIAREQLDRAVKEARDKRRPMDDRVHQLRARIKRARAALRLVRANAHLSGRARQDDRWMRDVARTLARTRDAAVEAETLRRLVERFGHEMPHARETLTRIEERVARRATGPRISGHLGEAVQALSKGGDGLGRWPVSSGRRAVERGIRLAYRKARRLARSLREDDPPERFHGWRKTVKRLGYQLRLLREAAPELWWTLGAPLERLGELLGDAHDLASLQARASSEPQLFGSAMDRKALLAVLERESAILQAEARALGSDVLSARPREIAARVDRAWRTWRR